MKLFTRVKAVALVAAVALGLAGCGSGGSGESADGVVTLTLLSHYGSDPAKSGLQKLIDQWNSENPKIQVKPQVVAFDDLLTTMTVRQTGDRGADIVSAYGLWGGNLAKAGVTAPVPADIAKKIQAEYSPAAVGAVTTDGTLLGYPTELSTYVLYYNKKILAEAGITEPPTTWAELKEDAQKTAKKDASGNTQVMGLSLLQDGDNKSAHPFFSLLNSAGGEFLDQNGKAAFDSEAGRAALGFESDIAKEGLTDPAIMATKTFSAGQVAMAIQAGWWVGSLKTELGADYEATVGTAPIPGPEAGDVGSLAYGFFMGVNNSSKHQPEAWQFLTWLNEHKGADGVTGMGAFMTSMGLNPARPADAAILEKTLTDPNLQPIWAAAEYAMPEPNRAGAYDAKTALHTAIMTVLIDGADPDATLATVAGAINAIK